MARESDFRQRAVTTANLLLEAASMLQRPREESSLSDFDTQSRGNLQVGPRVAGPSNGGPSLSSELRGLFNWTPRSSGGKRKAARHRAGGGVKKAKVLTWTHTWVCLSRTVDDAIPDATERMKLKLAGLGERRFAVDAKANAQELYDELEFQFPKLKDGGGFELLRASEGGWKGLEVIDIPSGGYTCDYLKAVVHSAKLYIRPLQTNLSLEPCNPDVSTHTWTDVLASFPGREKGAAWYSL